MADDRVALVAELVKILVVGPDILGKLELADEARADHERCDAALCPSSGHLRVRRAVSRTAADHPAAIHVRGGIARVHPPNV